MAPLPPRPMAANVEAFDTPSFNAAHSSQVMCQAAQATRHSKCAGLLAACAQLPMACPAEPLHEAAACCQRAHNFSLAQWNALMGCAKTVSSRSMAMLRFVAFQRSGCDVGKATHSVHVSTEERFKLVRMSSC